MARFIPNENTFVGYFVGPVGTVNAPTGASSTAVSGQGTLEAGSYSYKVTAFNDTGETVASAAAAVTTSTTGGVRVNWSKVDGATGYNLYGRSGGTWTLISATGDTDNWLDTGALTPTLETPPEVTSASNISSPHVDDVNQAVELTKFITGLNASSTGNNVPTPDLKRLFETSILGTSTATFTMDCYRDDVVDTAWNLLPRKTEGFMIISRHGGIPNTAGDHCEVWPIRVTSRAMANMANNTVVSFTITCAVPYEPEEDAIVIA